MHSNNSGRVPKIGRHARSLISIYGLYHTTGQFHPHIIVCVCIAAMLSNATSFCICAQTYTNTPIQQQQQLHRQIISCMVSSENVPFGILAFKTYMHTSIENKLEWKVQKKRNYNCKTETRRRSAKRRISLSTLLSLAKTTNITKVHKTKWVHTFKSGVWTCDGECHTLLYIHISMQLVFFLFYLSLYSCAFKCFHGNFSVGTIFPLVWRKLLRLRCAYVSLRVLIFLLSVSTNTNALSCHAPLFVISQIIGGIWLILYFHH